MRALGRAGWRVGVASPDGDGLAARSRWCDRSHVVPRPRGDGRDFLPALAIAVRAGGYDLVVGGADDWAAALATWGGDLDVTVGHPDAKAMLRAIDKLELARAAAAHGLATPRTEPATDATIASWRGPVVVKCRSHWAEGLLEHTRIEASRHDDVGAAAAALGRIRAAGLEAVLQEPVRGELSALVGLHVDGRLRGRVQQRSAGTWPTPLGVSATAETVPVDERLAARASALLEELEWSGLVELQFLTPPGGEPMLIDLNGRYFGSMALSLAAGPNLPDAGARVALGEPLPPLPDGRPGVRYVWTAGELRRAWVEQEGGRLADLRRALRRVRAADAVSVFSTDDLGPTRWLLRERLARRG